MSDFLYSKPSFLEGMARNLDLFGVLQKYNSSETQEEADAVAFSMDIKALREDFSNAWSETRKKYVKEA